MIIHIKVVFLLKSLKTVSFFLTGGTATLGKALKATLQSYKSLAQIPLKAAKNAGKIVGKTVQFGLDTFVQLVDVLADFIKNIPKHLDTLKGWMDAFIASLQAKVSIIDDVAYTLIDPVFLFAKSVFKLFKANSWKKLNGLGVSMLKSEDGFYIFYYNSKKVKEGLTKDQAEEFLKELFTKSKDKSDGVVKKYLDELVSLKKASKSFEEYLSLRKKYLKFEKKKLLSLWDDLNVIQREVLSDKELYNLYFKYFDKYLRKSKRGNKLKSKLEGRNFAEFEVKIYDKQGNLKERFFELSHSGRDRVDNDFLDVVTDSQFLKNVEDFEGVKRGYDSEVRFIYNFIKNHLSKEGTFEIVTKNIFIACDSCKRELLMLQEMLKGRGSVKVISVDEIKGTKNLKDYLQIK